MINIHVAEKAVNTNSRLISIKKVLKHGLFLNDLAIVNQFYNKNLFWDTKCSILDCYVPIIHSRHFCLHTYDFNCSQWGKCDGVNFQISHSSECASEKRDGPLFSGSFIKVYERIMLEKCTKPEK